jgi:hypothetical protein
MKKIIIIPLVFCCITAFTQQNNKPVNKFFSIGISKGYNTFLGNNFLAKTYNSGSPIFLDLHFLVYKNLGIGCYYRHSKSSLKSTDYVGLSTAGNFGSTSLYMCYYLKLSNKIVLMPKIGIAAWGLQNELKGDYGVSYDYTTNGSYYSASSDINYFIGKHFSVFANAEYDFLDLRNVNANTSVGTSYNSSNQVNIQFGIRIWDRK